VAMPIFDQIKVSLHEVSTCTVSKIKPYPGCEIGYNLFGADFLVDAAGRVYILEINAAPGFPDADARVNKTLSDKIFGGINEFVLNYSSTDPLKFTSRVFPSVSKAHAPQDARGANS